MKKQPKSWIKVVANEKIVLRKLPSQFDGYLPSEWLWHASWLIGLARVAFDIHVP